MKILPTQFEGQDIRRVYDEVTETWWFSVVDVVQVLTQQPDDLTARKYWNQLKRRLAKEGSQLVTECHQLKMPATDGKQRLTDVATARSLLRLVQSVPSREHRGHGHAREPDGRQGRRRHCQARPAATGSTDRSARGLGRKLPGATRQEDAKAAAQDLTDVLG